MNTKPQALLMLGPTGAGKTPLGDLFQKQGLHGKKCHHLDFGNELRSIAAQSLLQEPYTPEEHQFIIDVLEKGLLLENEHFYLANKIIRSFLKKVHFHTNDRLILNGIPRHKEQADDSAQVIDVKAVLELTCHPHVIYERIHKNTGGDRTDRVDDDLHMIEKKIEIYTKRTSALVNYYKEKGCKISSLEVLADSTSEDVYRAFLSLFMEHPIDF